jgi:hypothetical protein
METSPLRRRSTSRLLSVLLGALLLVVAAGCSDDSDDSSDDTTTTTAADSGGGDESTTTAGGGESEETKRFDETIQQELKDVGCYSGEIDGILGPESDAAILAFQRGAGIEADGELGPETESALATAVDDGETVCGGDATTTTHSESTTTTTGGGGGGAPCTATAISAALSSGSEISSYVCSGGYAAGSLSSGEKFIVQDDGSSWAAMSDDPCGSASAGLPPIILEDGCAS